MSRAALSRSSADTVKPFTLSALRLSVLFPNWSITSTSERQTQDWQIDTCYRCRTQQIASSVDFGPTFIKCKCCSHLLTFQSWVCCDKWEHLLQRPEKSKAQEMRIRSVDFCVTMLLSNATCIELNNCAIMWTKRVSERSLLLANTCWNCHELKINMLLDQWV